MLMKDKEMEFSPKAAEELRIYGEAVKEIMGISVKAYETGDMELASNVEPLEEVIDELNQELKKRHIRRLRKESGRGYAAGLYGCWVFSMA